MRSTISVSVMAFLWAATGTAEAQTKAEIISTARVWDGAKHVTNPDLIRFAGRWFLACQESEWDG